ncbi:MAG: nickel-dependent lactate racemase [candidate division Zixibacteria bacterium]|nr:nickel-dependent lactate racemase [candidate division Zixibacteria bacterium]
MQIELKYGKSHTQLKLDDKNLIGVLQLKESFGIPDVIKAEKEALANPVGSEKLSEIAKGKKTACVVVADYTRGCPYKRPDFNLLLPIIDELRAGGIKDEDIKFLVGTGAHRAHTKQEDIDNFGEEIVNKYEVISHDCDKNNVSLGTLSTGNELLIDKVWVDADVRVMTGLITTHYFGGYSGGRKGVLPGITARETIRKNHAMIVRSEVDIAKTEGNPISDEMDEAARKGRVDFLLNVVINDKKEIVKIVAGDVDKAFDQGWKACRDLYLVPFKEKADVVFACAGGYPKDVSLYQSQKTINNGKLVLKDGGTIVLISECSEGIGSDTFAKWLLEASSVDELLKTDPAKIVVGGHTAVGNAKVLKRFNILVVSSIPKDELEKRFYKHAEGIEQAIEWVKSKHGENFRSYVMPQGGLIYPCPEGEVCRP